MGQLDFQITGLQPARRTRQRRSSRQFSLIVGALLATAILTRKPATNSPGLNLTNLPDFGNQFVGTPSPAWPVSIQNTGTMTLRVLMIDALTPEGNPSSDFMVSRGRCAPTQIEPGEACPIGIEFNPKGTGLRRANLVISDSAPGSPHTFTLQGAGILPPHADARTDPPLVDFGTVNMLGTRETPLTILSVGDAPLPIEGIQLAGDPGPFSISPQSCTSTTIPANGSCQITVSFTPRQPGAYSSSISINTGGPYPLAVPLQGNALGPRWGYCCIGGKIDKNDEGACTALGGKFSENLEELQSICQPPKHPLAQPIPIRPGNASIGQAENLFPCSSIQLSWRPVEDPGDTVSYTVSLYSFSAILKRRGEDPWQPFKGFPPTNATQFDLPNLLPNISPRPTSSLSPRTAMKMTVRPPQEGSKTPTASILQAAPRLFYWQVVATDTAGNTSLPSEPRYFQCQYVVQ